MPVQYISTHTLRKEGDLLLLRLLDVLPVFQPTPSARRVTPVAAAPPPSIVFQPTPSARRVTNDGKIYPILISISTHTLRKEGDSVQSLCCANVRRFQPTPSARRVTTLFQRHIIQTHISTHTLRKEGDTLGFSTALSISEFQPTPSARRVTYRNT